MHNGYADAFHRVHFDMHTPAVLRWQPTDCELTWRTLEAGCLAVELPPPETHGCLEVRW
jgi:hypothetical protein